MFRASRCACALLRSLTFGVAVWWIKILAGRRLCTFRLRADRAYDVGATVDLHFVAADDRRCVQCPGLTGAQHARAHRASRDDEPAEQYPAPGELCTHGHVSPRRRTADPLSSPSEP